jgi:hypothetical protein
MSQSQTPEQSSRRFAWRRLLQFRLSTLLVAVTCLSLFLGWFGRYLLVLERQWIALDQITEAAERENAEHFPQAKYKTEPARFLGMTIPKRWNSHWELIAELEVNGDETTLEALHQLKAFPYLQKLDLGSKNGDFSDADLPLLSHFSQLRELRITSPKISGKFLSRGELPRTLTVVGLVVKELDGPGIQHLGSCDNLKHLSLWEVPERKTCGITDWDFLGRLSKLEQLQLVLAVNDDVGASLGKLKSLKNLGIQSREFSDAGFQHISECENLVSVVVFCPKMTDKSVAAVSTKKNLNEVMWSVSTPADVSPNIRQLKQDHPTWKITAF